MKKYPLLLAAVIGLLVSLTLLPLATTAEAPKKRQRKGAAKPATETKVEPALRIFMLKNGSAAALTETILPLFRNTAEPRVVIVCDQRTNSIIARGSAAELEVLQSLLIQLDAPTDSDKPK